VALVWFDSDECFRRIPLEKPGAINRALFDLTMHSAIKTSTAKAKAKRAAVRIQYTKLLQVEEFNDLISRAVDHTKRTKRRFAIWNKYVGKALS
jgi:hypothetical protein